jgi:secreted trypsin-like serine protease
MAIDLRFSLNRGIVRPFRSNPGSSIMNSELTVSRIALTSILVLMASVNLRAGMILDGVDDALYRAHATNFPSVGQVGNGSGVLIAPNWVLTAAHISDSAMASFQLGNQNVLVTQRVRHPQFINLNRGYDLALLRLATPIVGVTPVKIYTGTNELGATISMAGFGSTGVGSSNNPQNPGTFRAGTNIVDGIFDFTNGAQDAGLIVDFDAAPGFDPNGTLNTLGNAQPTSLEYQLAGGDSGGGAFLLENGEWYLAGIHSGVASQLEFLGSGSNQRAGYGAVSVMTRVSRFQDFIASVSGVPEPGSVALIGVCLVATGFAKRKLFVNLPGRKIR